MHIVFVKVFQVMDLPGKGAAGVKSDIQPSTTVGTCLTDPEV
jgi:hypothetical protein